MALTLTPWAVLDLEFSSLFLIRKILYALMRK